ncbi:hypothetical protein [uncultured Methanobrevibacter sp.]|uniref:hypothetical protein n=1 Tax=uncultured Methanobrevibacter sp. TaxID=253161 RepID=UPI0025FE7E2F|nr:hypothetical protein [uncultured Methanobrevibacter sp.]
MNFNRDIYENIVSHVVEYLKIRTLKSAPAVAINYLHELKGNQITRKLHHIIFQRDNYRCGGFAATNKETRLHMDYTRPVAKGGTNNLSTYKHYGKIVWG